jgi:hypothetical protein
MATLLEIRQMFADDDFRNRVTSATVIAANALLSGTPTVDEKAFAKLVFQSPVAVGSIVTMAVLAANSSASVAQMRSASDTAIQNQVNAVVPNLVGVA